MVESVDKVKALDVGVFSSLVKPVVSARMLSTGAKTLVLLYYRPDYEYIVTNCGDNCARWVLESGKHHDISITLTQIIDFGDEFDIVLDDKIHVTSMTEFIKHFNENYYDKFICHESKM